LLGKLGQTIDGKIDAAAKALEELEQWEESKQAIDEYKATSSNQWEELRAIMRSIPGKIWEKELRDLLPEIMVDGTEQNFGNLKKNVEFSNIVPLDGAVAV
jgi:Ca2+-binding EF-hand superfamily protein